MALAEVMAGRAAAAVAMAEAKVVGLVELEAGRVEEA